MQESWSRYHTVSGSRKMMFPQPAAKEESEEGKGSWGCGQNSQEAIDCFAVVEALKNQGGSR
jgi:hypothetical protein